MAGSLANGAIYKGDLRTGEGGLLYAGGSGEVSVGMSFDERSGYLTGEGCPNARRLPFITGSEPRQRTDCAPRGPGSGGGDWFDSLLGRN